MFEEAAPGANGAAAAADRGRALLHDPRIARLGFALQFVIQVCNPAPCALLPTKNASLHAACKLEGMDCRERLICLS